MKEKDYLLPGEKSDRKVLVRKEAPTSDKYGCRPEDRKTPDMINYGIANIDKPAGPTSHQVSAYVKDILKINKCGHSGTLDPNVTGCLPIALGEGTRIVQTLLPSGKEYVCLMHIHKEIPDYQIRKIINEFIGKITQLPPIKSAVKRQERERSIYYIQLLEINGQDVLFKVGCQAGTYIRKLCHDIGLRLGCGAHMANLRRTKAGPFKETDSVTLVDLADAYHYYKEENDDTYLRKIIQPVEKAVEFIPKIWVFDTTVETITHGVNLKLPGVSKVNDDIQEDDLVAIMTLKDELVALGRAKMNSKALLGDKGMAVVTEKVFMKSGTYPKLEKN